MEYFVDCLDQQGRKRSSWRCAIQCALCFVVSGSSSSERFTVELDGVGWDGCTLLLLLSPLFVSLL